MDNQQGPVEYEMNNISVEDVQAVVARVLRDFKTDAAMQKDIAKANRRPEEVQAELDRAGGTAIRVTQKKMGIGLVEGIVVAFTPVAVQIVTDLWTYVILPRIRKKYGDESLQEPKK